ncbi:MAG: NADH-quinone oxidoreductase subunit NuoG [Pseudomonadota bacterium]|nr:NADH-quinone oxidoreductase subunit NuoG [Pseudomonadota bacterium]
MSDEINLSINGKSVVAKSGERLIDVAKRAGDYIPRFCYHPKLSVVASCRMCLVEIEGVPKPQPACAMTVTDGMVVQTQSQKAIEAQKSIMQFLLINHPLSCPICDQGGECELQDTAMGYGEGVSEYTENKRAVTDEDLGPLVATDMSLCIHCTRCVRFGKEIAGVADLGLMGRGDDSYISTYLNKGLRSELSGNMIDLCPVGALTSKPFQYRGRSWGFKQHRGISPHDCVGSNLNYHTIAKGYDHLSDIMRVLPAHHPTLNESWLSDRDRFSYEGVNASTRLTKPQVKEGNRWREVDWQEALTLVVQKLEAYSQQDKAKVGAWLSSQMTVEEGFLAQKLFRHLGVDNIDYRLWENTKSQDNFLRPASVNISDISKFNTIVLIGANIRYEQPIIAMAIKQASDRGVDIHTIGAVDYQAYFKYTHHPTSPQQLARQVYEMSIEEADGGILAGNILYILGEEALIHPEANDIKQIIHQRCQSTNHHYWLMTPGPNSLGMLAAGCVPHQTAWMSSNSLGMGYQQMLDKEMDLVWLHQVDPMHDVSDPERVYRVLKSAFVIAPVTHDSPHIRDCADIMLPIAAIAESPGSYINFLGELQSFSAATRPKGEAKMGWSLYQVMGKLVSLDLPGDFETIKKAVHSSYESMVWPEVKSTSIKKPADIKADWMRVGLTSWVRGDMQVRHAQSLQEAYPIDETVYCDDQQGITTFEAHLPSLSASERVAPGALLYEKGFVFYGASCGEVKVGDTA